MPAPNSPPYRVSPAPKPPLSSTGVRLSRGPGSAPSNKTPAPPTPPAHTEADAVRGATPPWHTTRPRIQPFLRALVPRRDRLGHRMALTHRQSHHQGQPGGRALRAHSWMSQRDPLTSNVSTTTLDTSAYAIAIHRMRGADARLRRYRGGPSSPLFDGGAETSPSEAGVWSETCVC